MLELTSLVTRYGAVTALDAVTLHVGAGEVVALVGPNGAGKTTLLNTVAGLLRPSAGTISFDGAPIAGAEPADLVRRGLSLVPEHRRLFNDLTVEENLRLAAVTVAVRHRRERVDEVAELFAVLRNKWSTRAGYLSGGEAQQLAIARALIPNPRLLLLDEPTLGLAPTLVDMIFELLHTLREQGRTMLVVEQNAHRALEVADRGYVLRSGRLVAEGVGREMAADPALFESFMGGAGVTARAIEGEAP
ncbi:MAG: ABC transporter ATP-binding protein [Ilumatobacteraceae bacterium]